ncbi:26S proteasome regulatory subunit [Thelotrema lepadinum]|nr:26S proteasome regulatory subunit [Thelotrema lepadinum]
MSYDPEKTAQLLADLRSNAPEEFQQTLIDIEDNWDQKLWHQLTDVLVNFFSNPDTAPVRKGLFQKFISTFADKINQLKYVYLGLLVAPDYKNDEERLKFFKDLTKKVDKPSSQDAYVYSLVALADVKLRLEDYEDARKDLDKAESILDTFDSVETEVHAAFYRTNARYYQAKLEFAAFYKNALLYLACIDPKTLSAEEASSRAYDLSLAALVSDTIYNFGELLLHPILDSLSNTEHSWLPRLLFAYNRGDLAAYSVLEANLHRVPLLQEHKAFLRQKISLSALTEAVFRRSPHDRAMTFDTIAKETQVEPQQIEILIMKALSLGLLRGSIDQVAEVARINWVQPKVLDMKQVDNMRGRLKEWDSSVNQLGHWIEGVGKDVWAA